MKRDSESHFKKATIKDVAKLAGVSVTTVSQFLGGKTTVCSPETGLRIKEAASTLYYTPSAMGRGLRGSRSKTIGICAINPAEIQTDHGLYGFMVARNASAERNQFFERLWRGMGEQADRLGYQLLLYPSSVRRNENHLDSFLNGSADGIIFLTPHSDPRPEHLARAGFPTVTFGQRMSSSLVSRVHSDESQVVDIALSHLWSLGHRRIAHIAGPVDFQERPGLPKPAEGHFIALARLEAYRNWMKSQELLDPDLIQYALIWDADYVEQPVRHLLSLPNRPTAIFCANDRIARKAIETAKSMGLQVPQDVSIIGVDNDAKCSTSDPGLTSVNIEVEELGRNAIDTIDTLIQSDSATVIQKTPRLAELVVRASVCQVPS